MSRTRKLNRIEIRVLGALLEKEQTTPDQYPMTINALIAACNQKTNRDPVTHLSETEVVEALDRMRLEALVWNTHGARSERWQQSIDRRWELSRKSKPIMTLLLLRGPQTAGELKTRGERMHRFESVDEVEATLRELSEGFDALVCELPRRPGQRETRWMHLESSEDDPREQEAREVASAPTPPVDVEAAQAIQATQADRRKAYDERLEQLESNVGEMQETLQTLVDQVARLHRELGMD